MAIRGSLAEAGLPDVLQLLALGRKTGCLSLARSGDFGSIYFDAGRVAYASLVNRRDRIGERLAHAGSAPADDAARHARTQVEEAVLELFTWTQGTFSFEPEVRAERSLTSTLDPSSLLLEGARRADERARIAERVPGRDAVFAVAPNAPRDAAGALDVLALKRLGVELAPSEMRALAAVDGRRDVASVADAAGVVEFDASRALFAAAEAGVVQLVGTSAPPDPRTETRLTEHRNLGVAFYRASLFDEAARELRRVLELSPTDAHARFHLGLIALRRRRWADAAAALGEAAALPGAPGAVFHALAVARAASGEIDDAVEALDEAARRGFASHERARLVRAALELRANRVDAARALLDVPTNGALAIGATAIGYNASAGLPRSSASYHYAAVAAARAGDDARAGALLEAGVAAHPRAAALLANLAAHRLRAGRYEDALRFAELALAEDGSLAPAHKTAGDAHYRLGRHTEAAACFERAVAAAPALGAGVYLRLGNVRLREGDRGAAATAWRRAVALDPAHAIARSNLAALGAEDAA